MSKSKSMTTSAAARITSATARSSSTGNVAKGSFAARATSAAARNSKK